MKSANKNNNNKPQLPVYDKYERKEKKKKKIGSAEMNMQLTEQSICYDNNNAQHKSTILQTTARKQLHLPQPIRKEINDFLNDYHDVAKK